MVQLPQSFPTFDIPAEKPVIFSLQELARLIRDQIQDWEGSGLIAIDGAPGSGKSRIAKGATNIARKEGRGTVPFAMDWFLASKRGSAERRMMTQSPEQFEQYYCRDDWAALRLSAALTAPPDTEVNLGLTYDHSTGDFKYKRPIQIPSNPDRVTVFDGVGAIGRILPHLNGASHLPQLPVLVYVHPQVAMNALIIRDQLDGIDSKRRREFHLEDLGLSIQQRCIVSLREPKTIVYDHTPCIEGYLKNPYDKSHKPDRLMEEAVTD